MTAHLPDAPAAGRLSARARSERIYRRLRDRICLLDYPPGARTYRDEIFSLLLNTRPVRI